MGDGADLYAFNSYMLLSVANPKCEPNFFGTVRSEFEWSQLVIANGYRKSDQYKNSVSTKR